MFLSASKGADIGFVTIIPRDDGTLGFVQPLPDERVHLTRRDYEDQLDVFVAGRAAEELKYGKDGVSSGATQRPPERNDPRDPHGHPARPAGSGKLLVSDVDVQPPTRPTPRPPSPRPTSEPSRSSSRIESSSTASPRR